MRRSLENRARRLEEGLKRAQDLTREAPPDLPDPEELEEMEESERERLEALLEAITLAGSAEQLREEVHELRSLAAEAQSVEKASSEAKLSELKELLQKEGFFDRADQGDADLEDQLLRNVAEGQFRAICQNALEGLASKKLNLEMLIERRARAQERRVVPETIARFLREAAEFVPFTVRPVASLPHSFDPARTPSVLRAYEKEADWKLPALADRYPRCLTDRETAETEKLEWVTPGHPLFEAIRRHTHARAPDVLGKGATFHSLQHEHPARVDFYRARAVDGLGQVIHERLFAVEIAAGGALGLQEAGLLGNFTPADARPEVPSVATLPGATSWLRENALAPFLEETRKDRLTEVARVNAHVELSLTELLQRDDEEIGRAAADVEQKLPGAEGRLAQAESRHAELLARRDRRRTDLECQRALTLQAVERLTSVLVLPHPEREAPEIRRLKPDFETEAIAMRVVMEHEAALGRQVFDVSAKNLGYDITSLDLASGELRLIEVTGLGASTGTILLTPNERCVAEDRRDRYWLYVVTGCDAAPRLQEPVRDPARLDWNEMTKVRYEASNTGDERGWVNGQGPGTRRCAAIDAARRTAALAPSRGAAHVPGSRRVLSPRRKERAWTARPIRVGLRSTSRRISQA